MGGASLRGSVGGGGAAGLASVRVSGAGHSFGDRGGGGGNLDVGTGREEWEELVLQDTPIRGVGVANSSLNRANASPTSKPNSRPAPSGG